MVHSVATDTCPGCAAKLAPESRFCSQCGTRVLDGETLEIKPPAIQSGRVPDAAVSESPPAIHQVHRRPMGVHPVPLLGAVGAVGLVLAIVLLANGSLVAGLMLLALAVASCALFVGGVAREPDAPAAPLALRAANRARSLSGLAGVGARAWARAGLQVARIRLRQLHLRRQLKAGLAPLGAAVRQGDEARAEELKQRASEVEHELGHLEREASAAIGAARAGFAREQASVQPTRSLRAASGSSKPAERD